MSSAAEELSSTVEELASSPERIESLERQAEAASQRQQGLQAAIGVRDSVIDRYQASCTKLERAMLVAATRLGARTHRSLARVVSAWARHAVASRWQRRRGVVAAGRVAEVKVREAFSRWKRLLHAVLLTTTSAELDQQAQILAEAEKAVQQHEQAATAAAAESWAAEVATEELIAVERRQALEHLATAQTERDEAKAAQVVMAAELAAHVAAVVEEHAVALEAQTKSAAAKQKMMAKAHGERLDQLVAEHTAARSELSEAFSAAENHAVTELTLARTELDEERQQALLETEEHNELLLQLENVLHARRETVRSQRVEKCFVTWRAAALMSKYLLLRSNHQAEQRARQATEAFAARLAGRVEAERAAAAERVAIKRRANAARAIQQAERSRAELAAAARVAAAAAAEAEAEAVERARREEEQVAQPLFRFLATQGLDGHYETLRAGSVDLAALRLCTADDLTSRLGIPAGPATKIVKHLASWPDDPSTWKRLAADYLDDVTPLPSPPKHTHARTHTRIKPTSRRWHLELGFERRGH